MESLEGEAEELGTEAVMRRLKVKPSRNGWQTLVGEGDAFVAGLPSGFVLAEVLKKAAKVQPATAFARRNGWQHFRQGVTEGTGSVFLLTGLENCQTEPALLKEWLQLQSKEPKRIEAKLASKDTFFHPKVVIVTGTRQADFAIVGSGNLSQGGVQDNTECCVYVQDAELVNQLSSWFEIEFARGDRLNEDAIKAYEPSYNRNSVRRRKLANEQRLAYTKILSVAPSWNWEKAMQEAKKYFGSKKFHDEDYPSRQQGAADILEALKYPDFTFDAQGFKYFFSIGPLGKLNPLHRDKIFRSANRIKNGLRMLTADGEPKLSSVLDKGGKYYVPGFRLNAVTKFLAAYAPKSWPLFNRRVQRVLHDFGYSKPRGFSTSDQYLKYKEAIEKFMDKAYGELDALALDAFILHKSRKKTR